MASLSSGTLGSQGRPKVADLTNSTVTLKLKTADFKLRTRGRALSKTAPTRGQDFSGWMRAPRSVEAALVRGLAFDSNTEV